MENKPPGIPMSPEVSECEKLFVGMTQYCLDYPHCLHALASQVASQRHNCKLIFNQEPVPGGSPLKPKSG